MIFWFSATGNSLYVAKRLGKELNESLTCLAVAHAKGEHEYTLQRGERLGFVLPTYFWGIPSMAREFLEKLTIHSEEKPYTFVLFTTGGSSCNAASMVAEHFPLSYSGDIMMPDTYILRYDRKPEEDLRIQLRSAQDVTQEHIGKIRSRFVQRSQSKGLFNILATRLRYPSYEKKRVTQPFYADENCLACGVCCDVCPDRVIVMEKGKPLFTRPKCTLCLACIHHCPESAMQYGKSTKKRKRYVHPEMIEQS